MRLEEIKHIQKSTFIHYNYFYQSRSFPEFDADIVSFIEDRFLYKIIDELWNQSPLLAVKIALKRGISIDIQPNHD